MAGLEKTRVFFLKKKAQPSGLFWVLLGFFGFYSHSQEISTVITKNLHVKFILKNPLVFF